MRAFASTTRTSDRKPADLFSLDRGSEKNSPAQAAESTVLSIHRKASCACGGGCPSCQANNTGLKVSDPGDAAEIEADRVADQVMRMPFDAPVKVNNLHSHDPGKLDAKIDENEEEEGEEERALQRKKADAGASVPVAGGSAAVVRGVLNSGGRPLDPNTREFFESRFDTDLEHVRVHTGADAERSARAVDARAYTHGSDIVFGSGEYDPAGISGRKLLAHELAHVVQRSGGNTLLRKMNDEDGDDEKRKKKEEKPPTGDKDKIFSRIVRIPPGTKSVQEFRQFAESKIFGRIVNISWENPTTGRLAEIYSDIPKHIGQEVSFNVSASDLALYGVVSPKEKAAKRAEAARDYAKLNADDRDKVTKEIDRRYYESLGEKPGTKIKPGETGRMDLWNKFKEDVLAEKREFDALSDNFKKVLFGGGDIAFKLSLEDYAQVLRIARKLTPAQWAEYGRRVTGGAYRLDDLEKSADDYLAAQQAREEENIKRDPIVSKLWGLEDIYQRYLVYIHRVTENNKAAISHAKSGGAPLYDPKELREMEKDLNADLAKAGFEGGIESFETFIGNYLTAFRTETVNIAMDALSLYESVLYKESVRYDDPAEVAKLYEKLAPLRHDLPIIQIINAESKTPLDGRERSDLGNVNLTLTSGYIESLYAEFPLLNDDHLPPDQRIDRSALVAASRDELAGFLKNVIRTRKGNIKKSREDIASDPETVFSLNILIENSLRRQGIDDQSIFGQIVRKHVEQVEKKNAAIELIYGVLAIALAVVSIFVPGAIGVVAAVAGGALSVTMAYREFMVYESQEAAFGAGLTSEERSRVWLIVAVVGAALDVAQALKAVKAISEFAEILETSNKVVDDKLLQFTTSLQKLEKLGVIDTKIAGYVEKAGIAHMKSVEAAKGLRGSLMSRAYSFPAIDAEAYRDLVKLAFYKIKETGFDFLKFANEVRLTRATAAFGDLGAEEMTVMKRAYERAQALKSEEKMLEFVDETATSGKAGEIDEVLDAGGKTGESTELAPIAPAASTGETAADNITENLADYANGKDLENWLGKPVVWQEGDLGPHLPEGYWWSPETKRIYRKQHKKAQNYAELEIREGKLAIRQTAESLRNQTEAVSNYKTFYTEEIKLLNPGWTAKQVEKYVEGMMARFSIHHLIPIEAAEFHPIMRMARRFGNYKVNAGNNLQGLLRKEFVDEAEGAFGHWTAHPQYTRLVVDELDKIEAKLIQDVLGVGKRFDNLNAAEIEKLYEGLDIKKLMDNVKGVEDDFRGRIKAGKVPVINKHIAVILPGKPAYEGVA